MKDLSIAWRLVRGSGRRDILRLSLMALGIAVAVLAVSLALAAPRALTAAAARSDARTPVLGEAPGQSAQWSTRSEHVGGRTWTRVFISGLTARTPRPPGIAQWPAPGQSLASPALVASIASGELDATGLRVSGEIGSVGLADPDELLSYTTAAIEVSGADQGPVVVGFGLPGASTSGVDGFVWLEVLLLVGLPAVGFVSLCARLSVTSRVRRLRAFRLIGMSAERCAAIFAKELSLTALVGALLGVGGFVLLEPALRTSRILGLTWFPGDASASWGVAAVAVVGGVGAVTVMARRRMRAQLREAIAAPTTTPSRGWTLVGIGLLLPALGAVLVLFVKVLRSGSKVGVVNPNLHVPIVALVTVAGTLGIVLVLPAFTQQLASWLSERAAPLSMRLGLRLSADRIGGASRALTATLMLIMVASFAGAFLRSVYLDAVGDPTTTTVTLQLSGLPEASRNSLRTLDWTPALIQIPAAVSGIDGTVTVTVASCADFARTHWLEAQPSFHCTGAPQRVADGSETGALTPGTYVQIDTGPTKRSLEVPRSAIGVYGGFEVLLPPDSAPWAWQASDGLATYLVSSLDRSATRLIAAIQRVAPTAKPDASLKDPLAMARYVQQSAIVRATTCVGLLLCLLAFLLVMIDARWVDEKSSTEQAVLGMPLATSRRIAATQFGFPVLMGALVVVPFAAAASVIFLDFWGADQARYAPLWWTPAGLGALAVLLTVVVGWASPRRRIDLQLLSAD